MGCLRWLEWALEEPVPDPDAILWAVVPYAPSQADRIICALAELNPERAQVRRAFQLIVDAANLWGTVRDYDRIEEEAGAGGWRDLLRELRSSRKQFNRAISDKGARIALRWALRQVPARWKRASSRWLHHLRDRPSVLRKVIDQALGANPRQRKPHLRPTVDHTLQRDAGEEKLLARELLVRGVMDAYKLLTGKPLGRSTSREGKPTGPGVRLVRLCLEPLEPGVTDEAIARAIRSARELPPDRSISPMPEGW